MAATIELDETNGAGNVTHGVSTMNVGNVDAPNINPGPKNAIPDGSNSFVKYTRVHFTNLGGASTVSSLRVWLSQSISGQPLVRLPAVLGSYTAPTFSTPTQTALGGAVAFAASDPHTANIGLSGSLTSTLTAPGVSDYLVWQQQTFAGSTKALAPNVFNFAWEEA